MAPISSFWSHKYVQQYRSLLFALTALAVGYSIYYVNGSLSPSESASKKSISGLHRSNSVRRPRRRRTIPPPPATDGGQQAPDDVQERLRDSLVEETNENETDAASNESFDYVGREEYDEEKDEGDEPNLPTLLYRIAEENARKDGSVHRGVQCNGCSENPIRGIRYRCMNCADYDLCEQCEALQLHQKTHLFYKIRIPAPFIGAHKERHPVLYPGKPRMEMQELRREKVEKYCKETGFRSEEVAANWQQFRCMAATEWPADPDNYHLAIDRATFDDCFLPTASLGQPLPNLIYDRLFSYYDTNNDGLIGFEEFIQGLASLRKKNFDKRLQRVFQGYDLNGDGYIDRRDMLRMFRSYYELTKELSADFVAGMQDTDDEGDARDLVVGGQPLTSAFSGAISPSGDRRAGQGKMTDAFGDQIIIDRKGVLGAEERLDSVNIDEIAADSAERTTFPEPPTAVSGVAIWGLAWKSEWQAVTSQLQELGMDAADGLDEESGHDALRWKLHMRLASESFSRRLIRRKTILRRAQRRYFTADTEEKPEDLKEHPLEAGGVLADPRFHTRMAKDLSEIQTSPSGSARLKKKMEEVIKETEWPVSDAASFRDDICQLILQGWNEKALTEDLDGYDHRPGVVPEFVHYLSQFLGEIAADVRRDPHFKQEFKKVRTKSRSRSSSKVRFEDGVGGEDDEEVRSVTSTSSRNRPVNERWGGFELPVPEADVGREILYRVTQEAMNELLDPVFRLREDLALRALYTRNERRKYRTQIAKSFRAFGDLNDTWRWMDMYQRRWRESAPVKLAAGQVNRDEASLFREYVRAMFNKEQSDLTGADCPICAEEGQKTWVPIGTFCLKWHDVGYRKKAVGRRPVDEEGPSKPHLCTKCAESGERNLVRHPFCAKCGWPSNDTLARIGRFSNIVSRGALEEIADEALRQSKLSAESSQQPVTSNEEHDHGMGHSSPQPQSSREKDDGINTKKTLDAIVDPDTTKDHEKSVQIFEHSDVGTIDAEIASKPLEDLLKTSGYSTVDTEPTSTEEVSTDVNNPMDPYSLAPGSTTDPSLPQHRPNTDPVQTSRHSTAEQSPHGQKGTHRSPDSTSGDHLASSKGKDPVATPNNDLPPALIRFYGMLDFIEADDEERGGPGRLNYQEFEEIMKGPKFTSVAFIANWVEVGGF